MLRTTTTAAVFAAGLLFAAPAQAGGFTLTTPHTGDRPMTLELHAGLGLGGFQPAVGGRLGIPLIKNGFIGSFNNSVYLTIGVDLYTGFIGGFGVGFGVPITGAWNFYFNDQFSAFADVGINPYVYIHPTAGVTIPIGGWLVAGVGGRYHLNEKMALLVRAGSPYLAVGIELAI